MFTEFYHGSTEKYIVAFGNLFRGIIIQRPNKAGTTVQAIHVPIHFGPKERWLARLRQDPDLKQDIAITLPFISFDLTTMSYAPDRKLGSTQQFRAINAGDPNSMSSQYAPVPYDLIISMSVATSNYSDGLRIVEQIVPYFRPEFTTNIIAVPELDIRKDVPIVLQSVNKEDGYEGEFDVRRPLIWTLEFVIKADFYGPVSNSGTIIRQVNLNFHPDMNLGSNVISTTITRPYLRYANNFVVPLADIQATDPWVANTITIDYI